MRLFASALLVLFGIPISIIDLRTHRIPNRALTAFALLGIVGVVVIGTMRIGDRLIFALITVVVGLACHILSKGSIGMGDVKLIACISLIVGSLSALLNGLIVAAFLALIWRAKNRSDRIPMAPWIFAGTLAVMLI